ncbi:LysR substrate-binding domain-containing protein [Nannocystis sp. RBIL2]|uniref:LysR substrate-binding domain-containing protein n=1 Tax=Nannocystis sp. RBIL2 TaxID=2996788 RepID=UPI00226F23E0|nr:LysR substrate-binding domain-containing protein [Nannocystis sp. RBIL2]MCY1064549.1 LysR substrate-binding domain-containing protein [Nannocystis sp. RBIL2]
MFDGLPSFLAVANHKSFTAAAAEMGVSPTAMSQKIKLLEQRLGVVLFQRTTRRVALTDAGTSLFARLGPALAEVEVALATLGDYRGRPSGRLRLTAPRASGSWLLPAIVARMAEQYPELAVEVSLDDAFVDLVAAGFDAGIRLGDAIEKDMVRVPITKQSAWAIVAAPSYLARAGRPRKPEDLLRHRAIRQRMIATGVVYRWELERQGKSMTVDVPGSIVVDDVALMVALAIAGAGLAYVLDEAVADAVADGRLERVLGPFVTPGPGFCLYFPARTQEQPKLKALVEVVKGVRVEERTGPARAKPTSGAAVKK